jgi:hypothetical protein
LLTLAPSVGCTNDTLAACAAPDAASNAASAAPLNHLLLNMASLLVGNINRVETPSRCESEDTRYT